VLTKTLKPIKKVIFRFSCLFSFSLISAVSASELHHFDRNVVGFVDHTSEDSILMISEDGNADWIKDTNIIKKNTYNITHENCIPRSQSTMTMDAEQSGMTLAYPFLVGVGRVCKIDEETNSINLVTNFDIPTNSYSIVYAGEDTNTSYFLMNVRPWTTEGYLLLVSINKTHSQVETRILMKNVPGLSGAMHFNKSDIWVTSWPGKIYKVSSQKVIDLIHTGAQTDFLNIAELSFENIDGMSFFLLANNHSLLYYNYEYESYMVNISKATQSNVSVPCLPIKGYHDGWLVLCEQNSLQVSK